jgi:hypothetical protein
MRHPTLTPLDRMKFPLALADGLRITFADVVSVPLTGRLAALMRRLNADRDELSGGARSWGKHNRNVDRRFQGSIGAALSKIRCLHPSRLSRASEFIGAVLGLSMPRFTLCRRRNGTERSCRLASFGCTRDAQGSGLIYCFVQRSVLLGRLPAMAPDDMRQSTRRGITSPAIPP